MAAHTPTTSFGLYVHIPFCLQKCRYCDFYSVTDLSLVEPYLQAIQREIQIRREPESPVDTIYMGGGTPSVLKPNGIATILKALTASFRILPKAEITMEVNPGTVDSSDLKEYATMGINRLSIGIQSFDEERLRFLGRIHTAQEAAHIVTGARHAGFSNISLDLISGLPGQTRKTWTNDLHKAVAYLPEHLSCYMLTYETGTPLDHGRQRGEFRPLDEALMGDLYTTTCQFLQRKGYRQYETSNFACSENFYSRHNRKYWQFHPYLGFGPSAHSYRDNTRSWNCRDAAAYIRFLEESRLPVADTETLSREQQIIEFIYLGLRQTDGIGTDAFYHRFGVRFETLFSNTINLLKHRELLRVEKGRCYLTAPGMLLLDSIVDMFVSQDFIG